MYVINNFVYGHELAVSKETNNSVSDYDLVFGQTRGGGRKFEVSTPYHGGQVSGDTYSVIFGIVITDDDQNKEFSKEIRAAKAEDYEADYALFLEDYIRYIQNGMGLDDEEDKAVINLISFLREHKPDFYTVQSSS